MDVNKLSEEMMKQNIGHVPSDIHRLTHTVMVSQGNTQGIGYSYAPHADRSLDQKRWNSKFQDARSYKQPRVGYGEPYHNGYSGYQTQHQPISFGQNNPSNQFVFSTHTGSGRSYQLDWNLFQPVDQNRGTSSHQYPSQCGTDYCHQTLSQHGDYASEVFDLPKTPKQESRALDALPQPTTQAQAAPPHSLPERGNAGHGNQSVPSLWSSTANPPSNESSHLEGKQSPVEIQSPRPVRSHNTVNRWISATTPSLTRDQLDPIFLTLNAPFALDGNPEATLSEEEVRRNWPAYLEFLHKADQILGKENRAEETGKMEESIASTTSNEDTPRAPAGNRP
ncbi:hypothetical protein F4810DRAFT_647957 [Camillea tinctor]|nr:hypothetical protein F4810DRAFT_647957 [Camillea tinctor]